jgi:hypothetical protein
MNIFLVNRHTCQTGGFENTSFLQQKQSES